MLSFSCMQKKKILVHFLFTAMGLLIMAPPSMAVIRLNPQIVVDRILRDGLQSKAIDLEAQSAYTAYYANFGAYDLAFAGSASYEDSKIRSLSGGGNLRDQNTIWSMAVSKRMPTGTNLELAYNRTQQDSIFRTPSTLRGPYAVYDVTELTLTQDILGNFFGMAERQANRAAEQLLASATLDKKENQEELVLTSLKLFWDTYVAKESLTEAIAQKDRYEALVKEIESKSRLSISSPGDLPKARAEFGAQVRNTKSAFFDYAKNLDLLLTAMRFEEKDREVVFDMKEELPPLPTMVMPPAENLRAVRVNQTAFESADLSRQATNLSVKWPELKLVGAAGFTGLNSSQGRAFSEMASGRAPRYLVGLELNYRFFSDRNLASLNAASVTADQAYNSLLKSQEDSRQIVSTAMEQVRFTYAAAISAMEEMKQWEAAVKAQERSYKQGRLDFSQLIQDYNRYFQSRSTRLRALGDYHIALHAYGAAVDELVR